MDSSSAVSDANVGEARAQESLLATAFRKLTSEVLIFSCWPTLCW